MDCFIEAPNKTLAHHIWHRLADKNRPCYIIEDDEFLRFNLDEFAKERFLIGPSINVERITAIGNTLFRRNIFFNDKPFFEVLRVFYLSKKLVKEKKNFIDLCTSTLFTHGLVQKLVRDVRDHFLNFESKIDLNFRR